MDIFDVNFAYDFLNNRKKQAEQKDKMTNIFAGTPTGIFAEGGGIHIKKSNEGKFTAQAKRAGMGVQEYASHVLANKDRYPSSTVRRANFARNASKWHADGGPLNVFVDDTPLFAFGGNMQTNSADFSTGLTHINAGQSHEESPYDGVQLGVDPNGVPNLVEENETVWNDYVFSARITADDITKKKFHLPKKKDITYAEISKRLEKEIKERPNDPVSKASFKAQMEQLADEQERQKQEMEAERAKAAFEALSPEEQTALMQQKAQEEAIAEQAIQQQAMAEAQGQPTPEELAMAQGQMSPEEIAMAQQQADGSQAMVAQQPMAAYGGRLYAEGGDIIKKGILKLANARTFDEFKEWAKKNNVSIAGTDWDVYENSGDVNWDALRQDASFIAAISKDNPALAHALSKGYDFGAFVPDNTGNVTFRDISKGNWLAQDYEGWKDSQDPAWLEAVERGLVKEGMKQEEIAQALKQTDKYRMGTKWLQDSEDNRLRYLRTILEDANSPEVAKNYARKFIDANGWKEGAARDYATIFGAEGKGVRETHPGTYWHTPVEATRGALTENYLINPDGTVSLIEGDTEGLESIGSHAWNGTDNYTTYNYYRDPNAVAAKVAEELTKTPEEKVVEEKAAKVVPDLKKETSWGLFGPAVGLGLQLAGVGRPDTAGIDAAIASASQPAYQADYQPIGDYLTYKPLDLWYEQNALNAQARAADRTIMNSSLPTSSKYAALLANGYNTQLASGNLFRQAQEYNDNLRKQTSEFNRGTNQFNAEAYNRNSQFNADALNRANQHSAQIALQGAAQKADMDAGWYNGIYGNISGIFDRINQWEKWKRDHNTVAKMAADSLFGNMSDKQNIGQGFLKVVDAEGGKVKRKKNKKRGLTI